MVNSQFSLNWESFKSSVCGGFSALQQNGELVDMTLAADGHFVKVHQVLMALVSPYLKELITSAPCQHPVIFLNNVSSSTLSLLLQYVYTGEVVVPYDQLNTFTQTAQALHIRGLEELSVNPSMAMKEDWSVEDSSAVVTPARIIGVKRPAHISEQSVTPKTPIRIKRQRPSLPVVKQPEPDTNDEMDYSALDDTLDHATDDDTPHQGQLPVAPQDGGKENASQVQFSVSIRGSLQVILNRYIYNLHSQQHRSGVRRWRCVDYRNLRCMAYILTNGNVVLSRANPHNHSFHDKKILQKIEKKSVFTALDDVVGYTNDLKESEEAIGINQGGTNTDNKQE